MVVHVTGPAQGHGRVAAGAADAAPTPTTKAGRRDTAAAALGWAAATLGWAAATTVAATGANP